MLVPEHSPFAVLVEESRFTDFTAKLEGRADLTHAYLVTDSEEAFRGMASQIIEVLMSRDGRMSREAGSRERPNVIQLHRDYLENFVINKGEALSN